MGENDIQELSRQFIEIQKTINGLIHSLQKPD